MLRSILGSQKLICVLNKGQIKPNFQFKKKFALSTVFALLFIQHTNVYILI
jgi:hypothetical protein